MQLMASMTEAYPARGSSEATAAGSGNASPEADLLQLGGAEPPLTPEQQASQLQTQLAASREDNARIMDKLRALMGKFKEQRAELQGLKAASTSSQQGTQPDKAQGDTEAAIAQLRAELQAAHVAAQQEQARTASAQQEHTKAQKHVAALEGLLEGAKLREQELQLLLDEAQKPLRARVSDSHTDSGSTASGLERELEQNAQLLDATRSELQTAQDAADAAEQSTNELRNKVDTLRSSASAAEEAAAASAAAEASMRGQFEKAMEKLKALTVKYKGLRAEKLAHEETIVDLGQKLSAAEAAASAAKAEAMQAEQQAASAQALHRSQVEQVSSLQGELEDAEKQLVEKTSELERMLDEVQRLRGQGGLLVPQLEESKAAKQELQCSLEATSEALQSLQGKYESAVDERSSLKASLDASEASCAELHDRVRQLTTTLDAAQSGAGETETTLQEVMSANTQYEEQLIAERTRFAALESSNESLQERVGTLESRLSSSQKRLHALQSSASTHQAASASASSEVATLRSQLEELQASSAQERSGLRKALHTCQDQLQASQHDAGAAAAELRTAQQQAHSELQSVLAERDDMRRQLAATQYALEEVSSQHPPSPALRSTNTSGAMPALPTPDQGQKDGATAVGGVLSALSRSTAAQGADGSAAVDVTNADKAIINSIRRHAEASITATRLKLRKAENEVEAARAASEMALQSKEKLQLMVNDLKRQLRDVAGQVEAGKQQIGQLSVMLAARATG